MILRFTTKRDYNGNRLFLEINTDKKIFTRNEQKIIYTREDSTQTTKKELRKIIEDLKKDGYKEQIFI